MSSYLYLTVLRQCSNLLLPASLFNPLPPPTPPGFLRQVIKSRKKKVVVETMQIRGSLYLPYRSFVLCCAVLCCALLCCALLPWMALSSTYLLFTFSSLNPPLKVTSFTPFPSPSLLLFLFSMQKENERCRVQFFHRYTQTTIFAFNQSYPPPGHVEFQSHDPEFDYLKRCLCIVFVS
jgi:hypothetical protein